MEIPQDVLITMLPAWWDFVVQTLYSAHFSSNTSKKQEAMLIQAHVSFKLLDVRIDPWVNRSPGEKKKKYTTTTKKNMPMEEQFKCLRISTVFQHK